MAITALATLALMADGSSDGRGRHGPHVKRGLDFLLAAVDVPRPSDKPPGYFYFHADIDSRMHGQGYAMLALATALGNSREARATQIQRALRKAVDCAIGAQTVTGGYGYDPSPGQEHEGSVTVAVAQGLRAARDAGLHVDRRAILRGLHYLRASQNDDGSFNYSLHLTRPSYALTAAAVSSFLLYGEYGQNEPERLRKGIRWMMDQLEPARRDWEWWYYGNFHAAWAAWQWDGSEWDPSSRGTWAVWHSRIYPDLIALQTSDGSWSGERERQDFGPALATAFAVLTLAIPDETLPIFQR